MPRPPGSQGGPGVRRDISRALQSQQVKESSASDQRSAWAPGCQGAGLAGGPARGRLGACRMEAWPGRGLGDREAQSQRAEFYCYIKVPRPPSPGRKTTCVRRTQRWEVGGGGGGSGRGRKARALIRLPLPNPRRKRGRWLSGSRWGGGSGGSGSAGSDRSERPFWRSAPIANVTEGT